MLTVVCEGDFGVCPPDEQPSAHHSWQHNHLQSVRNLSTSACPLAASICYSSLTVTKMSVTWPCSGCMAPQGSGSVDDSRDSTGLADGPSCVGVFSPWQLIASPISHGLSHRSKSRSLQPCPTMSGVLHDSIPDITVTQVDEVSSRQLPAQLPSIWALAQFHLYSCVVPVLIMASVACLAVADWLAHPLETKYHVFAYLGALLLMFGWLFAASVLSVYRLLRRIGDAAQCPDRVDPSSDVRVRYVQRCLGNGDGLAPFPPVQPLRARDPMQFIRDRQREWEQSDQGIMVINKAREVLWVNEHMLRQFGYGRSELVGQNVSVLMPDRYAQHHDTFVQRACSAGSAPHSRTAGAPSPSSKRTARWASRDCASRSRWTRPTRRTCYSWAACASRRTTTRRACSTL